MFGGLGNIAGMLKQAKAFQENMQRTQEMLAQQRFEADAGAGMVRAIVNGKGELIQVKINPTAVSDIELLEDMVTAAVSAATKKAQDSMREEMSRLTGGLNIPGLSELMGQQGM